MHLTVLLALVGFAAAAVHQQPLTWQPSKRMRMAASGELEAYVEYKEKLKTSNLAAVGETVYDYGDYEYLGNITIGSPDQSFIVVLDTASANLFIPAMNCDATCNGKHKYDPSKSSTFAANGKTWTIQYGAGNAKGVLVVDTVRFGAAGSPQLAVPTTTFGIASHMAANKNDAADGILGLAFTSLAIDGVVPPLINAINQNLLDLPLFTVYLEHRGLVKGASGGVFTYGGLDATNCGAVIAYQPLSSATYFEFQVSGFGLGTYMNSKTYSVISDTGESYIGGTQSVVDQLAKAAGAVYHSATQSYSIDCNATPPPLTIVIGANTYSIQPVNYIVATSTGKCLFAMFPYNSGGFGASWVLGDPFIRQYCNIYDLGNKRMGFAPSKQM